MTDTITIRPGTPADAGAAAGICFEAFTQINRRHGVPPDFQSPDVVSGFMSMMLGNPHVFSAIAEDSRTGKVIGSNFLWDGSIGGIGPITVDPNVQDKSVGRRLMQRALEIVEEKRMPGVRLVQAAFNARSLSLYTKLGFDVREPLACLQGDVSPRKPVDGHPVRKAKREDVDACDALCVRVHGHARRGELENGIEHGTALVVEHAGRITGYATDIGFFSHAVAESNADLIALIAGAEKISGPGLLLPSRNGEVFRWCLAHGLRVVQPMTLMSRGLYAEPRGAFTCSILF